MWMHSLAPGMRSGEGALELVCVPILAGYGARVPVLGAAQPGLEMPCPNSAGKIPAACPSLKSPALNFARGMPF